MTRILADHGRSLRQVQTNNHRRNVSSTSTSNCSKQREHPGRIAEEYGTGPECCSNHLSFKDKWSHNEQSSPMGYQVKSRGITRELDKEPSLHCFSLYTTTLWSMLQQCVYLMSIHHASTSCPITHPHVFSLRPPCFLHVSWHHTFNLRYTCAYHMHTMRNPCPLISSPNPNSLSRLFPILLDPKSFQTALDSVTWLLGHVSISYLSSLVD